MNLAALLALGAGLSWGVGDFVGGRESRRLGAGAVVMWSQLISGLVLWCSLALLLDTTPSGTTVGWALIAGVCGGTALAMFYRALAIGAMSLVAPVAASGVAIPVMVSIVIGELPTALVAAGIAVTAVAVVLVSLPPTGQQHVRMSREVLVLSLGAAVGFAGFLTCMDQASVGGTGHALWAVAFSRCGSLAVVVPFAIRVSRGLPRLRGRWLPVAAAGLLDTAANVLYALATTTGVLAVVAVLASLYSLATVVLARIVLGEQMSRGQMAGVAGAVAGVALIATG